MIVHYLHVFCDFLFSFEIFSTHLTLICFKYLLHMKEHLYEVISVTFVEKSSRLNGTWKNINKKSTCNILVPSQRYQDFWLLLQNQKTPQNVLGFSNHAQRFTPPYYLDVDNPFESFSKCEIQRLKKNNKGDPPDDLLLIQVVLFPVSELEFHFKQSPCQALGTGATRDKRSWCIHLYVYIYISF